jgi:structural maintenance of chromosomes protein 5
MVWTVADRQQREQERAMEGFKRKVVDLQKSQEEMTRRGKERRERIQQAEHDLAHLDSQAGQQSKKLFNISRDTSKLWEWVQENQKGFEKPIFGPPVVECSVTDPRYVDMIETLFQKNVFLSFTVQTNNDFKKLQHQAHEIMNLSEVNIKVMPSGLGAFAPPVGPDELRHYGFQGWAIDYLKGPEPVLAMLCFDLRLHRTAIMFKDTTAQQFEQLQNSPIDSWLTSKSSYNIVRRREYGPGATSTRVREVRRATVWTDQPVDLAAKRELQDNIHGWGEEVVAFRANNAESQAEIVRVRDDIREKSQEIVRVLALIGVEPEWLTSFTEKHA